MFVTTHGVETILAALALIAAITFVILHVILAAATHIWWLLAFATIFLAMSDLVMRQKKP